MCSTPKGKTAVGRLTFWFLRFLLLNQLVKTRERDPSSLNYLRPFSKQPPWLSSAGQPSGLPASTSLSRHRGCVCTRNLTTGWEVPIVHEGPKGLFLLLTENK